MRALPYRVTVISREEIRQQLALGIDTSHILSNLIPGFSPSRQKLTGLGETLRGRSPLFMVDGVPQSDPLRDTSRDGYTVDLETVERIEVLHGANAIQGLGASGGIINFITLPLPSVTGVSNAAVGSLITSNHPARDLSGYKLGVRQLRRNDDKTLLLSANWQERGLYEDGNGDVVGLEQIQGDLMDTQSRDLLLKAAWEPAQQRLQLNLHYFDITSHGDFVAIEGDVDAGMLTSTQRGDMPGKLPGNERTTVSLDYAHTDIAEGALTAKVFHQQMYATFGALITPILQDPSLGSDLVDQSQIQAEKQGAKISYSIARSQSLPLDISIGADAFQDRNEQVLLQTDRVWSPEIYFQNYAPFVQADYPISKTLLLSAGLRQEYADLKVDDYRTLASSGNTEVRGGNLDFTETLHNLGAVWSISPTSELVLNIAEGFGMPDAGRVLRSIETPGLRVEDFLDITPLVTENREVGWIFHNDTIKLQLNYFESETAFGTRLEAVNGIYTVNREQNEVNGWEFTSHWNATANTRLDFLYSQIAGKFDSDGNGQVDSDLSALDMPPDHLSMSWNQHWSDTWFSRLQINRDFARHFHTQDASDRHSETYTLADLMLDYRNELGTVTLGIANLTNRQYVTYFTQVEGLDDRYFAGRGRTFQVSFRGQF
jgi:iron complex outermembrane receptor protein